MTPRDVLHHALPTHARECHGCGEAHIRGDRFRHRIDAHTTIRWSSAREVI